MVQKDMVYWRGKHPHDWRLAHNPVQAVHIEQRHGDNGFRVFWLPPTNKDFVKCACGWRPNLGTHYRQKASHPRLIKDVPRQWIEEYEREYRE